MKKTHQKQAKLNIQLMKIEDLFPADYNPRKELKESDLQYQNLKNSIQEFDYVDPLVFNTKTKTLISGNQRLNVLKDLGYTEVEVNCVDFDPVKEKVLNIALNKIKGDWDEEKLSSLISELTDFNTSLEFTGFSTAELEGLLSETDISSSISEIEELNIDFEKDFEDGDKKGQRIPKLIFGKYKVAISQEELELLERAYDEFLKENGVEFGFVNRLLMTWG